MPELMLEIDAERERLYALAKELGLAWGAFRRRVYATPEVEFTDEELATLPESTDAERREMEIESETVSLLNDLADVYKCAERPTGDA